MDACELHQNPKKMDDPLLKLEMELDIKQLINGPPRKKIKSEKVTETECGNSTAFSMSTAMVKSISNVLDLCLLGTDSYANITFDNEGIYIFGLFNTSTVCIAIRLGKAMFVDFVCDHEVKASVTLSVIRKQISTLQTFKPQKMTFSNDTDGSGRIVITAFPANRDTCPNVAKIVPLSVDLEELDLEDFNYDIKVRIPSKEVSSRIEAMPAEFTLEMDCKRKCLVFRGKSDQSSIQLPLRIDDEVVAEIKKIPGMANFSERFQKSFLHPLKKGAKTYEFVYLAFCQGMPLFASYHVNSTDSKVSMYFSAKFD
jgi:hypothetical protein